MKQKNSTFGWIMTFAGQKKSGYIASVILAALGAAFQILPYFVMAGVIGKLLAGNKDLAGYLTDCARMALCWLLRVLLYSLSTAQSHRATFAVLGNIRKQGLAKLARMPLGDVQARGSGELKNILVERVDAIEPTLAHVIPEMSGNAIAALATFAYLLILDWRMALVSLLTFPLGMVFFMLMMAGYDKNYARTVAATNTLNDTAVEYIGGIEVIKVFGKAKSSYEKFVSAARTCAQSDIDWMNKSNFYFTFAMNVMPATLLPVLPIGGLLLKSGALTPEKFVLIVILSMGLITPVIGCMKFTDDLAKVSTIIGQVTDILTAPELRRPQTDVQTPQGSTVALHDVHFGYGDTEVLHGVSLTFREGTVNALVGPSGGGKSTLCQLLARFWDVDAGAVTLGGHDVREYDMDSLMRNFSFVFQNVFLFHDTVANNIRFGCPGAPMEQVVAAAKKARCHDFIMKLPQGYETVLGEAGSTLSGGERQRLSIARAIMKDAPVIILDEATANVDPENEKELMEAVGALTRSKTVILIAHRLKTVRNADQILVVDKGQIVQRGTHETLMAHDGLYRRFISGRTQAAGWKL